MSTVNPQVLTSIPSSSFHGTFDYRYYQTVNNKHIYALWHISNNDWASTSQAYSIRVDTLTDTWEDNGPANPASVTLVGANVELYDSGSTLLFKFEKPTTASWISGGGGSSSSTSSKKVFCNFW